MLDFTVAYKSFNYLRDKSHPLRNEWAGFIHTRMHAKQILVINKQILVQHVGITIIQSKNTGRYTVHTWFI